MPPDKLPEELPWKWRQVATPILLTPAAFAQLVLEDDLKVKQAGIYSWAAKKTQDGHDLYQTPNNPWYLYQARRVNTSGGAGALVTRISMNAGQVGKLVSYTVTGPASAGATLDIVVYDEDGALNAPLANCAAGANRRMSLPTVGTAATASLNFQESNGLVLGPGEELSSLASTSLITETLTIAVVLLLSTPDIPVWAITGSVAGSALAASTISAANTLQLVAMP